MEHESWRSVGAQTAAGLILLLIILFGLTAVPPQWYAEPTPSAVASGS